jgi:hypothetical protein
MATEQTRDLPGLEGRSICALEDLAAKFVDLKARRKALKTEEDALTTKIIALMRKHQKDHYKRDGLEILIELAAEKVKVTMRREEREDEDVH